jgi:acyl-CoA thioester hydrolase
LNERFETSLVSRSYECDSYGHINHAVFLNYLEVARIEFLKSMGYTLDSLKEEDLLLPIVKLEIEYKRQIFAGDRIVISVEWIKKNNKSAVFEQMIFNEDKSVLISKALITWVAVNLQGKPVAIPNEIINKYENKYGTIKNNG